MSLKRARTPNLEIAYEERGETGSPPIILVHGFPDDARTWVTVSRALADVGFRTIAPNLRGFGETRFLGAYSQRSGQFAALGQDILDLADAVDVERFVLVGHDWGARAAYIVASVYPERVRALVTLSVGYGTNASRQLLSIDQAQAYWYQWYFNTDQGRAALEANRRGFCRKLWETWSPGWRFSEEEFEATARSFDNPDFVEIAIHSYRHRWGNAPGHPQYEELEACLAGPPSITIPTTVIIGADDGATLPETSVGKEHLFTDAYERCVLHGVGHFIQRERPEAVVEAIIERTQGFHSPR